MMKGVPSLTAAGLYVLCKSFIKSNEERQGLKVSFLMEHPLVLQYTPCKPYWKRSFFQVKDVRKQTWGTHSKSLPMKGRDFTYPQSSAEITPFRSHQLPATVEVGNMGRLFLIYIHLQPWKISGWFT